MLAFRYIDHQEGHCSGIFSSWPWKALELIQWVGPKTMAECSFPLRAQVEEWGGGTARAAGIEHSARHPDLLLYTGSLNRDRHLSPKTPSLYLETLTQFEKRWCVHIAFFKKIHSTNIYQESTVYWELAETERWTRLTILLKELIIEGFLPPGRRTLQYYKNLPGSPNPHALDMSLCLLTKGTSISGHRH